MPLTIPILTHYSGTVGYGRTADYNGGFGGLVVGGGDLAEDSNGVGSTLRSDGHGDWVCLKPTRNYNPIELTLYNSAARGRASATNGTDQIVRVDGSSFSSDWIGKHFWFNRTQYKVATVTDGDNLTVQTTAGGVVVFGSGLTDKWFHYCVTTGSGTCDVSGSTVIWRSGTPFEPFITGVDFMFSIAGTPRTVSAYVDAEHLTLSSAPGDVTNAAFTYDLDINSQLSTFRVQNVAGSDEMNLSIYARPDGYYIQSLFSGNGEYMPIFIGTGEYSSGNLRKQIALYETGELALGGISNNQALTILAATTNTNRFDLSGSTAGVTPSIRSRGGDTNVPFGFDTKGVAGYDFTFNSFSKYVFRIGAVASGVNYFRALCAVAGSPPAFQALGDDTDIDLLLTPKGAGNVRFGTFTSNADAPVTGYVTVKDAGGTARKLAVIA